MGRSEHKQQLITLARRRAFETYLRFGHMPREDEPPTERKAINPAIPLPIALPRRATRFYVWRSNGDNRVRQSHAARHGEVFAWDTPPSGGHPGTEPNCRCWPDPYYGDPTVPDALEPLAHHQQVSTDPTTDWASIETLTRSDGSMAQSLVVMGDGTTIRSRFQTTSVLREVTLADGQVVRVDTESGLQSIYLGDDSVPQFQSRWTPDGPEVVRARRHTAFLLTGDPFNDTPVRRPEHILTGPGGGGGDIGLRAIAFALVSIFRTQNASPASQGLGERDEPVLAVKSWTADPQARPAPILVGSLTEEQQRNACRFLPDVQKWTDEAAALLAEQKPILPARTWGSLVHGTIKRSIDALKASMPFVYDNLRAEISFAPDAPGEVSYGQKGSTRLDVVEDRRKDMSAVCNYDVKTGRNGLTLKRLREIAERLAGNYPGAVIYIIEVRPRL
ncbi:minor capsid protein [Devosia oryziradicis]|uniref:Minor capsid protein n=1 Tax=Devosia oryziradicis TaxID=2801335 RepID=A0ABX7C3H5_9HYPH|nr:minor capsid protein [Devosia oryziradicis]QQR36566.1 minor capsid protein [Devosia oryziradicis]